MYYFTWKFNHPNKLSFH